MAPHRLAYREEAFVLPAADGAAIYGYLDQAASAQRSERLVVCSHGLTGSPNEYHFKQAQRYFNAAGYDVVRFFYYTAEPGARRLKDTTLRIHANDLNAVCDHFRPGYRQLFVIGHSYGGLTMLLARPDAAAYAFWDSAFVPYPSLWRDGATFAPSLHAYLLHWSSDHVIGAAMMEEARAITDATARGLAASVKPPSLVAVAGRPTREIPGGGLYDSLGCRKSQIGIPGADHGFTAGETVFDLIEATHAWFDAARNSA